MRSIRVLLVCLLFLVAARALAAPEAVVVMDGRTGAILRAENADTPLHPASLTKMMTLWIAFDMVERGAIHVDAMVKVSATAAAEPGSRLGLQEGSRISIRHLIRAVAVKSANDAATALAEALSGSEEAFVARMNATAAAMGLSDTAFRNAHGLTEAGHLTTARDMSVLGRRLRWDFPGYWGLFSRRTADAGLRRVAHTNRRFLGAYAGADGIKTGYTRAAGFNLTASARRGERWLIVTVFGQPSSAARAAHVARLMDWGFARLPETVAPEPPPPLTRDAPARGTAPAGAMALAGLWAPGTAAAGAAGPDAALPGAAGGGFGAARPLAGSTPTARPEGMAPRGGIAFDPAGGGSRAVAPGPAARAPPGGLF